MSYICRSCALRAQSTASSSIRHEVTRRTFSQSSTQSKHATGAVPSFIQSQNPDLTHTLTTLRQSYFIPAYLNKRQRNLIYRSKYKNELEYAPATATLGGEEFKLSHVDRKRDVPARQPLVSKALALMREAREWRHLSALLQGLHAADATLAPDAMEKVIRQATEARQFSAVVACLTKSEATGMTLGETGVLRWVLRGLRTIAARDGWDTVGTGQAIRFAGQVAELLEGEGPRARAGLVDPVTIGAFLEVFAVDVARNREGKDVGGKVKGYATRLVSRLDGWEPARTEINVKGSQEEVFAILPVWHGLRLARQVLGRDMPDDALAQAYIKSLDARLKEITQTLKSRGPHAEGGYVDQALKAYEEAQNLPMNE